MSDADLNRDLRLADRLGQLPQPALPAGLAARIVANATRLPQDRGEPAEEQAPVAAPPEHRRWRWLPHAIGTAIAASVVAALFLQQGSVDPAPQAAAPQIVQQAPAPLPQVKPESPTAAPSREPERFASTAPTLAPKPKAVKEPGKLSPSPEPTPAPSTAQPHQDQTPELATEQNPPGSEGPTLQAYGPPASDDRGAPMLQSDPSSGLGISGTASPSVPAPAPSRPGRGSTTMPRF
ncbi:hypothetical protein KRR38_14235 [Novosphingobium sp. G106]|uniref:hypothetical protein n=1 Tax=Novosphingobium sp. G106 TaxID=2849500 RepID=UPI001C2D11ED|nr:hypothetical protein [Novosphingobium sp. G106]MBV1688800.1 hypothetical protein [Novosphingobium sp. G106]